MFSISTSPFFVNTKSRVSLIRTLNFITFKSFALDNPLSISLFWFSCKDTGKQFETDIVDLKLALNCFFWFKSKLIFYFIHLPFI